MSPEQAANIETDLQSGLDILDEVLGTLGTQPGDFSTQAVDAPVKIAQSLTATRGAVQGAQNLARPGSSATSAQIARQLAYAQNVGRQATAALTPFAKTPAGVTALIAVATATGIVTILAVQAQTKICKNDTLETYGGHSLDSINQAYVLAAAEANRLSQKLAQCQATQPNQTELKNVSDAIERRFGSSGEYTKSLNRIAHWVKANNSEEPLGQYNQDIQKAMVDLSSQLYTFNHSTLNVLESKIDEACEDTGDCGEVIQELDSFMNTKLKADGNLRTNRTDPLYNPGVRGQGKVGYDRARQIIYSGEFSAYPKISFMAHVLARHGGTKNIERNLAGKNESMFYTDRLAFQAAIEALLYQGRTGAKNTEDRFIMPSQYWVLGDYTSYNAGIGNGVGFGKDHIGRGNIRHTKSVQYYLPSPDSCSLNSVHPEFRL